MPYTCFPLLTILSILLSREPIFVHVPYQIADKGGIWYYYDDNFRHLKTSMSPNWSNNELEVFILAMAQKQQ